MGDAATAEQYELLSQAYLDFKVCAQSPGSVNSKCQLASLTEKLQKQGIYGSNALQLLTHLEQQIGWQAMHPDEFRCFYQFVFFVCRDQGKRNVQVPVAIAAWRGLLEGRFRLLERWCAFMSSAYKAIVVTEDTWTQLLEFSRTVLEDLSNYDPTAAWPVALDEFVEYIRAEHTRRCSRKAPAPMDLSPMWPSAATALSAVSPRSGSKRRMQAPGVAEVADQLQQLPLACDSAQREKQMGMAAPSDKPRTGQHPVKRYRVAGAPPPAAPPASALGFCHPHSQFTAGTAGQAAAGFHIPHNPSGTAAAAAGQQRSEFGLGVMMQGGGSSSSGATSAGMAGGLYAMTKTMAAAEDGRPAWGAHSQQQQHVVSMETHGSMAGQDASSFSLGPAYDPHAAAVSESRGQAWGQACGSACQQQHESLNNMGGSQQHLQLGRGQGGSGGVGSSRCSGFNTMMHATVTDTLFYT